MIYEKPTEVTKLKDLPKQKVTKQKRYYLVRETTYGDDTMIESDNPKKVKVEYVDNPETQGRIDFRYRPDLNMGYPTEGAAEVARHLLIKSKPHHRKLKVKEVECYEGYAYNFNASSGFYNKPVGINFKKERMEKRENFQTIENFLKECLNLVNSHKKEALGALNKAVHDENFVNAFITDMNFNKDLETVLTEETA